jgi:hypothetical protein
VKRTINPGIEIERERETAKGFYNLLLSVSVLASCEALYCPQIDTVNRLSKCYNYPRANQQVLRANVVLKSILDPLIF